METQSSPQIKRTLGVFSIVLMVCRGNRAVDRSRRHAAAGHDLHGEQQHPRLLPCDGSDSPSFLGRLHQDERSCAECGRLLFLHPDGARETMGLGAATMALLSYVLICIAVLAYLGYATANTIALFAPAIEVPWWVCAIAWWAAIAFLGYRNIDLSSKVLGVFLVLEVLSVTILDVAIIGTGWKRRAQPRSFLPEQFPQRRSWAWADVGVLWLYRIRSNRRLPQRGERSREDNPPRNLYRGCLHRTVLRLQRMVPGHGRRGGQRARLRPGNTRCLRA